MSQLLRSATLVALDPPSVEQSDLRIAGGFIVEAGRGLEPHQAERVIDLGGKLIMPGLVCGHTHLYSALARGMPAPARAPANFKEILESVWWRLDRALDDETIYWSALAGALEAARSGTTCLFDHHASPSHIRGSLQIVSEAIERVGLRAVLCYEVTDRGGLEQRDDGAEENRAFLRKAADKPDRLLRGMVGAHASFTLSDKSLRMCAELMAESNTGLHIHVAEDLCDVKETRERHNTGIIERLVSLGAINEKSILAHGTHLTEREIGIARDARVWFAHNPRSNANNRVGYAPVGSFGDRLILGTDGIGADMFEETSFAFLKARENAVDVDAGFWLRLMATNQHLAGEAFGIDLGTFHIGAAADLIVLDYRSPTPITKENLASHFLFGLSPASIESVMVNGKFVIERGSSPVEPPEVWEHMQRAAKKLWAAMEKL